MKQGDILLATFPFSDGSASKLRPVLVVSSKKFNDGEDVVVVPISSREGDADRSISVGESDYKRCGLKMVSSIQYPKPVRIAKSVLMRKLGALDQTLLEAVLGKLRSVFVKD